MLGTNNFNEESVENLGDSQKDLEDSLNYIEDRLVDFNVVQEPLNHPFSEVMNPCENAASDRLDGITFIANRTTEKINDTIN